MKAYRQALRRYRSNPSPETATNLPYLHGVASAMHAPCKRRELRPWVLIALVIGLLVAVLNLPSGEPNWSSSAAIESEVNSR